MTLTEISILGVWQKLGGGRLRDGRGPAFWRNGDGFNIALDAAKGAWFDFRDGRGGGVLGLVETALGCDRRAALQWLAENCELDSFQPSPPGEWLNYRQERDDAYHFAIATGMLAEMLLDELSGDDPGRAEPTHLLAVIRQGGAALREEFRAWLEARPEIAKALVQAGRAADARMQRRLALFLAEVGRAA